MTDPTIPELRRILEILLDTAASATPVLGVYALLLNQPVMERTDGSGWWLKFYSHRWCSREARTLPYRQGEVN